VKRARAWLFGAIVLVGADQAYAVTGLDGGGRDLSVALFSSRTIRAITITPVGPNAWTAACAQCVHKKLTEPVHFAGAGEVFAGGTLRVVDDGSGDARTAAGLWHLRAAGPSGEVDVVFTLPSERYVAAVLNAEAAPDEPAQSLRALAIVVRTYALNSSHFTTRPGHLAADLCDSTECQAMRLGPVSAAIEQAVQATAGETLWFGPRRAEVFFSQSCGGTTEDGGVVWPKLQGVPYLRSHADPYCARRDSAAWHAEIALTDFAAIAKAEGWRIPAKIVAVRVGERSPSHRALQIAFLDGNGEQSLLAASALRFGIGRALGWNRVRSDAYELGLRNGALVFDGRGHGHGVGLCQTGAAEMASEGKDARAILAFYFRGAVVRITARDDGWQETHLGAVTVRTNGVLLRAQTEVVQRVWEDAQRRFPPRKPIAPEIVFAPTTELFRQITARPGWTLASTRGATVVLQSETVMHAHAQTLGGTLLHEMLHVLVEAETSEHAPLWLREGLVEVLAGEAEGASSSLSIAEIESELLHAGSQASSERAHRAAAARVRALIVRYGASTVRGWLTSGPPADIA
jgi:stage II sporulation protein D